MTPLPRQIVIYEDVGTTLPNTLGRFEREAAAALIIRFHQVNSPDTWRAFTPRELAEFAKTDDLVQRWGSNPFWRMDMNWLVDNGHLVGWTEGDPQSQVKVTEKFVAATALHARRE
jgi:hypothetical protein